MGSQIQVTHSTTNAVQVRSDFAKTVRSRWFRTAFEARNRFEITAMASKSRFKSPNFEATARSVSLKVWSPATGEVCQCRTQAQQAVYSG